MLSGQGQRDTPSPGLPVYCLVYLSWKGFSWCELAMSWGSECPCQSPCAHPRGPHPEQPSQPAHGAPVTKQATGSGGAETLSPGLIVLLCALLG